MNSEKAREFFSAYYEETLEKGLRQAFEQKLRTDPTVKSEYNSFVETLAELDSLKFEEIPVPLYLNARIAARLDEARTPVKQQKGLMFYLPRLGIAAAAAAAIVATIVALPRHSANAPTSEMTIIPSAWPAETIQISGSGSAATLEYTSAKDRTVRINDRDGRLLRSFELSGGQPLKADLTNPNNSSATIFDIQVSDEGPEEMVAVPGSKRVPGREIGSGTILDFALAIANRYATPVLIDTKNLNTTVSWSLNGLDEKEAVDKALDGLPVEEIQTATGTLSLKNR